MYDTNGEQVISNMVAGIDKASLPNASILSVCIRSICKRLVPLNTIIFLKKSVDRMYIIYVVVSRMTKAW